MNKTILMGRLCADPDVRYTTGDKAICVARYRLAVNRMYSKDEEQQADFISCVAFGKNGEFAEKYLHKGIKIVIVGRIQTGSYTNKDGQRVYTTDVVVENQEFAESKGSGASEQQEQESPYGPTGDDGFMNIPDNIDEELPFS